MRRIGQARAHLRLLSRLALVVAVIGVFCTWTRIGPVTLNGTQGANNGWLIVLLAAPAYAWLRMLDRSNSRTTVAVLGVLGVAAVICWTALTNAIDNGDASVGYGLVLVLAAGLVLGAAAAVRGVELWRTRTGA